MTGGPNLNFQNNFQKVKARAKWSTFARILLIFVKNFPELLRSKNFVKRREINPRFLTIFSTYFKSFEKKLKMCLDYSNVFFFCSRFLSHGTWGWNYPKSLKTGKIIEKLPIMWRV